MSSSALNALRDRLDAADPGALRRYHAMRTAFASLSAWLIAHYVIPWLANRPMPPVALFAVVVCFLTALVIVDAPRQQRRGTLLLSFVVFAAALVIACLLNGAGIVFRIVLLALIFLSYTMRRRGLRAGELALILTMGVYFATGSGASWERLPWYLFVTAIGVISLWLWQFVLLPYDPRRGLRDSVRAFYRRVADLVGEVADGFAGGGSTLSEASLRRHLKRAKLSRRVIESQFPGVLAPGGWTEAEIGEMQLALYATERGLSQIVEGASQGEVLARMSDGLADRTGEILGLLRDALRDNSPESVQALNAATIGLQTRVRNVARSASAGEREADSQPPAPWILAAVRLAAGTHEVVRSAATVRKLAAHESPGTSSAKTPAGAASAKVPAAAAPVIFGKLRMHPTTALGIQAVMATGLAMWVAFLLNIDHSAWVFWTAFVVIAGSTGESLRRMMLRVVGTVAGSAVGVALALLLPTSTALIVAVATICIFLTIYFWPISYPLMVFWINIGFAVVFTRFGGGTRELLLARPFTTLLGGLVAALVVVFIFPIRTGDRLKAAAAQFLAAVDAYVAAFVDTTGKDTDPAALETAQGKVTTTYARVEQMLPSAAYENNPLMQAQSMWAVPATQLAALESEVTRLAGAVEENKVLKQDAKGLAWMRSVQERIHQDIQALILALRSDRREAKTKAVAEVIAPPASLALAGAGAKQAPAPAAPADQEQDQQQAAGSLTLLRIEDIITQLGAQLGAPAASMPN